jgi:phosphoenolpyruvate synthase/pyruvate phosphate dikinase
MDTTTPMARGINVVHREKSEPIRGTVKFIGKPKDAVALVKGADLSDTIVLTVGGAVTFAGTVLMKRPAALLTVEGAPESHLGILSREFDVPAVMSLELSEAAIPKFNGSGLLSPEYERLIVGALDGKQVTVDIRDEKFGFVHLAE